MGWFKLSCSVVSRLQAVYQEYPGISREEQDIVREVAAEKVKEFMQIPTPGEYVSEDSTLDTAIIDPGTIWVDNVGNFSALQIIFLFFYKKISDKALMPAYRSSPVSVFSAPRYIEWVRVVWRRFFLVYSQSL
jgi:hypothetical protein